MKATLIDGKKVSQEIREELKPRVQNLIQQRLENQVWRLLLVGDDPASQVYVRNKEKACEKLGVYSLKHQLSSTTSQNDLLHLIDELNNNPAIHGILVQLPLPKHLDEKKILYHINPLKDVDGFHPYNLGRLMIGDPIFLPCTPWGVQELLSRYQIDISRKHVVIVGRSNIVGKTVILML
jgi:methylenetetrahydrofolate dehydrogenase (NADP+)/methenyltetrahydrofolate cyclohydrolase